MTFVNLDIGYSKPINHLAQSSLAVLLLHVPDRAPLWSKMKDYYLWLSTLDIGLKKLILGVLSIYLVCIAIDQIRLFVYKPVKHYLLSNYEP